MVVLEYLLKIAMAIFYGDNVYFFFIVFNCINNSIIFVKEFVNVNIRMYNFDDVQCTVIPSVAYGFVTGMNLQLC